MPTKKGVRMAKQRFRDIKQGKIKPQERSTKHKRSQEIILATNLQKVKAALTDSFMLLMPLMYIVFYLVMDGREGFAQHKLMGWLYILVPLILIQTAFMYLGSGQTPGYRAYNIRVVDSKSFDAPPLFALLFRNISMLLSLITVVGWLMMFFRKDRKGLHDLLSQTTIITTKA
jgi:uncharacterized RDD family membrane protein YckC